MKKQAEKSIIGIITYFSYANFKSEESIFINNSEIEKNSLEYHDEYWWYDQYGSPYIISQ